MSGKPDEQEFRTMKMIPNRSVLVVSTIALGSFSPSVFAYLDPSTGSMILSAIVGLLATLGLTVKTYWYKLKSLFSGSKQEQPMAEDVDPQEPQ